MASKSRRSAAIAIVCAIAAVIFFLVVISVVIAVVLDDDDDPMSYREVDPYMTFEYMNVTVDWNDDRSCKITQMLKVRFHGDSFGRFEETHGIYVDIPVNSGEKVRNIWIKTDPYRPYELSHEAWNDIVRVRLGDSEKEFDRGDTFGVTLKYDYITPKHSWNGDVLAFNPIGKGWTAPVENAAVTVNFPAAPIVSDEFGIWVAGKKWNDETKTGGGVNTKVEWSDGNKTVKITTEDLQAFEGVEVAYQMPHGTVKNYSDNEYIVTLVIGLILLVAALVFKFAVARNKPLTPIVDYYPPRVKDDPNDDHFFDQPKSYKLKVRRMLPVQLGKIIDDSCSNSDVTSLIFYWASKGFLSINEREDGTYFEKLHDIDEITGYERDLFNRLFQNAQPNENDRLEISVDKLSGNFGSSVNTCKNCVNSSYSGKFYRRGFTMLSLVMSVLCGLYGVGIAVLTSLRVGFFLLNFAGILAVVPALLSAAIGRIIAKQYFKLSVTKRRLVIAGHFLLTFMLAFAAAMLVPFDVMNWFERIAFALCLGGASAVSPFLLVRTKEYDEQLNAILGFRDFLRDAEKDRLETLIEEDPQYYYDILPYANVLGVSDVWEDKFKDIAVEPPTYYTSYRGSVVDFIIIRHLTRSVASKLSYVPSPKVNLGSFSGKSHGGGGGFSGGGFSGGSFGGGGGGRW